MEEFVRRHVASRCTLERLFREQTSMSSGLWRQKARLFESIRLLAAAFKRTFGFTPRTLLQREN
jgi:AraC-like DNA-binding protein